MGALPAFAAQDPDLRARAHEAQAAMAGGEFDEAARIWAELAGAVPGEPGLRLNLGMSLSMAGRSAEALPHLEAATRTGRADLVPAHLFLGMARMDLGQPARAIEPLEIFLHAEPLNQDARHMLAEALSKVGRPRDAADQYEALTDQAPDDPRWWYGLGRSYEAVAKDALDQLQEQAPDSAWVLLAVAESMVAREEDSNAFTLYREALQKLPGWDEAHEAVARIYEREGHPEWAGAERQKARSNPSRECTAGAPECEVRAGRYRAALDAAQRNPAAEGLYWRCRAGRELATEAFAFLEALGPSPEATLARVHVLRARRRYGESMEALEEGRSAWPEERRLRQELATLHFIARDYQVAAPLLQELLEEEPGAVELNLMMGRTWLELRQPEKALPCLLEAARGRPAPPGVGALLGRAWLEAGDPEEAIPLLEASLSGDADGSVHFQLARAYQATGRTDLALETRVAFQEIRRANTARKEEEEEQFAIKPP